MEAFINTVKCELEGSDYCMFYYDGDSNKGGKTYHHLLEEITPSLKKMYCEDGAGENMYYIGFKLEETPKYNLEKYIKRNMLVGMSRDIFIELVKTYYDDITGKLNSIDYVMKSDYVIDDDIFNLMIKAPMSTLDSIIEKVISQYGLYKAGNLISHNPTLETVRGVDVQNAILNNVKYAKITRVEVINGGSKVRVDAPILILATSMGVLEFHSTDNCCGVTYLEDGADELKAMIGEQILSISVVSNRDSAYGTEYEWDVYTFYKIETLNHSCTLRFYEGSNYGEYMSVKFRGA